MITLDKAIEQAEKFTYGATFHAGSAGWKAVMAVLLAEVKRKPFEPDWVDFRTGFSNGYEQGKEDASTFCLDYVNYADSTMDHEELLINVAGTIKNLHYGKPNTGENLDPCRCPACQIAEETNEVAISKEEWIIEASHTLQHGVQIMTNDQVSRWDGVRALIELCPIDVSPRDYAAFPVVEETNEPKGPLPPAILADMIDHQADELADLAKEIEIFSISYSHHADSMRDGAKTLVKWAKEIGEEK